MQNKLFLIVGRKGKESAGIVCYADNGILRPMISTNLSAIKQLAEKANKLAKIAYKIYEFKLEREIK